MIRVALGGLQQAAFGDALLRAGQVGVSNACQNKRYRRLGGDALRERNR